MNHLVEKRVACVSTRLICVCDGRVAKSFKFGEQQRHLLRGDRSIVRRFTDHGPLVRRRQYSLATDTPETDVTKDPTPVVQRYKGKTAVIVGAGPAGLTAAAYLAKHGFSVKMFEGRIDDRSPPVVGARTINILLSEPTSDVLREVGIDLPSADDGFKNGFHPFGGEFALTKDDKVRVMITGGSNALTGTRYHITKALLERIECEYCGVSLSFNHRCKSVRFKEQKAVFANSSGKEVVVDYDLLIAADGVNSVIRKELEDFDKDFKVHVVQCLRSYFGLDGFEIPEDDTFAAMLRPGRTVFSRQRSALGRKYSVLMSYSLSSDGTVHLLFSADGKFFDGIKSSERKCVDATLSDSVPQSWRERIIEQLEAANVSRAPGPIFVNKLNGPRTILMGDAAHAVSYEMGFGCNLAVTDGRYLNEALYAADGELDRVPQTFNNLRQKTVQCYQELETGLSGSGCQLSGWLAVWRFFCFLHQTTARVIAKFFSTKHSTSLPERVIKGQISSVDAVNIIKRDCLVGTTVVFMIFFLAARHIIIPATKFALSKICL